MNPVLLKSGLTFIVFTWLSLVVSNNYDVFEETHYNWLIFPKFKTQKGVEQNNERYHVEKLYHDQKDGKDMNNGLYLTYHRYFLESFTLKSVKLFERKFSFNDICFKPHENILKENIQTGNGSKYLERLSFEARRLSPCLIVTPLNCYHDSYKLESEISRWKYDADYLNRRLRNSYLEEIDRNETKPYVKANDSLNLIEKWSGLMEKLAKKQGINADSLFTNIQTWIASLKPKSNKCADPHRSCDEYLESQNYYNMCISMKNSDDEKMWSQLDCVDDREKFVEWVQDKELDAIMKFISENNSAEVEKKRNCPGIFGREIEFFNEERNFGYKENGTNFLRFEFAIMRPEQLLESLNEQSRLNEESSEWTIDDAKAILAEWRSILKEEINRINSAKSSVKLGIRTTLVSNETGDLDGNSRKINTFFQFAIISFVIVLTIFSTIIWFNHITYSLFLFALKMVLTVVIFVNFSVDSNGYIVICERYFYLTVLTTISNLFWTTILYNQKNQTQRGHYCEKRTTERQKSDSNLSWISDGVSSTVLQTWTFSQLLKALDLLVKRETIRNTYKKIDQPLNKKPFYQLWLLFFAYTGIFIYFGPEYSTEIILSILPGYFVYFIEEKWVVYCMTKEIELKRSRREKVSCSLESVRDFVVDEFSGDIEMKDVGRREKEISKHFGSIENETLLNFSTNSIPNRSQFLMGYPLRVVQLIRFYIIGFHLNILGCSRKITLLIVLIAGLLIVLSVCLLLVPIHFQPSWRYNQQYLKYDDVWIKIQIKNHTKRWNYLDEKLKEFENDIDKINGLNSILGFEKLQNCTSFGCLEKWYKSDAITSAISSPLILPNRFSVVNRYEIANLYEAFNIVKSIDDAVQKLNPKSEEMSVEVNGLMYDRFHKYLISWRSFVQRELFSSVFFAIGVAVFLKLSVIGATLKIITLVSIFVVATKLEIGALVWLLFSNSSEDHSILTTLGLFFGFVTIYFPFLEIVDFSNKAKQTLKKKTIIPPVIVLSEIALFTIGLFVAATVILLISIRFFDHIVPSVLLVLVIFVMSIINSFVVSAGIVQFFENKVRFVLTKELKKPSSIEKIRRWFTKLDISAPHSLRASNVELHSLPRSVEESNEESEDSIYESEEENVMSEAEADEEVLAIVKEIESRWESRNEEIDEKEKEDFLRNVKASNVVLRGMIGEEATRCRRKEDFLNARLAKTEEENFDQPSTSSGPLNSMKYEESVKNLSGAVQNEKPHKYAKYFPAHCSNRLIDHLMAGKEFVEPSDEEWAVMKANEELKRSQMTPAELQHERELYEMLEQIALAEELQRQEAFIEAEDARIRQRLLEREERKRNRRRRRRMEDLGLNDDEGLQDDDDQFDPSNQP